MVDTTTLPRLDGAVNDPSHTEQHYSVYKVLKPAPVTVAATRALLIANGWKPYVEPLQRLNGTDFSVKKGKQGLHVSFTRAPGRTDQSLVYYSANRLYKVLPFPDSATEIVYDMHRPYLSCAADGTSEALLGHFNRELGALGWSPLSAAVATSRWPNANLEEKGSSGERAYYFNGKTAIVLSLARRADGKIAVEIKVPSFALPQELPFRREMAGLPVPDPSPSASSSDGEVRKELKVLVPADVGVVLAFYRRELAKQNWREEARGAVVNPDQAATSFTSAQGTIRLKLGHKYDLTTVDAVMQVSEAVLAERRKARELATAGFRHEAEEAARKAIAEADAKRAALEKAAKGPQVVPRKLAGKSYPVPLPDTAESVDFSGAQGRLEFSSRSSVTAIAMFYRAAMKSLGWRERPTVINKANMVSLEFTKGRHAIDMTIMQLGAKANVTADGSGLKVAAAPVVATNSRVGMAPFKVAELEAEDASGLPVPKRSTLKAPGEWKVKGGDTPFRRELDASVPAELAAVLAFYRRELAKRRWKEAARGAVVQADRAVVAFTAPEGPAVLTLGRNKRETTIQLVLKNPAAAAKAGVLPAPGRAKVLLGNMGNAEVAITINARTIKIPAGAGAPQSPDGPKLELRPGKYTYVLKVAGRPSHTGRLVVAANDAWGLMVAPDGSDVLALQMY
jgi:hypothetical protein